MYDPQGWYISGYTNPSYDVLDIDINRKYLEEMLGEDLSVDLVKEILDVEEKSAVMVVEKYQDLQADLGAMLQGVQG